MPKPTVTTGDYWPWLYKKQKNCPKLKSFIQLKHNTTPIPLILFTVKLQKPTKSFSSLPCLQRMRDISFNKPRKMTEVMLSTLRWEMQPRWMQKIVLTTFIEDPPSYISPCKRSGHLTQDPKRRPTSPFHTRFAAIFFQPVNSLKTWWVSFT